LPKQEKERKKGQAMRPLKERAGKEAGKDRQCARQEEKKGGKRTGKRGKKRTGNAERRQRRQKEARKRRQKEARRRQRRQGQAMRPAGNASLAAWGTIG
jgi:hypothetical protein